MQIKLQLFHQHFSWIILSNDISNPRFPIREKVFSAFSSHRQFLIRRISMTFGEFRIHSSPAARIKCSFNLRNSFAQLRVIIPQNPTCSTKGKKEDFNLIKRLLT